MNEEKNKLEKYRKDINDIDGKIIDLLNQRGETVIKIGEIKKKLGLEIYQPHREHEVIEKIKAQSKVLKPQNIESIWKEIIGACKDVQGNILRVGYFGPEGTFTHHAAQEFFPQAGTEFIPVKSIPEIFDTIEKDLIEYGVIPIENSLQGTVRETLDLLIEKTLNCFGEVELRIVQNLIGLENATLKDIKNIYSHPQAFAQTRSWVKTNLPNAHLINTSSTAEAVRIIKELNKKENAAIGTEFAAKFYELNVINSKIEDNPSNYTRFLIISKKENKIKEGKIRTSIVYVTKHIPGALYQVLKLFAEAEINLLKIESRPRRTGRWEYIFLMDFEGDKEDPKIKHVIEKMSQNIIWYKILGSYPLP